MERSLGQAPTTQTGMPGALEGRWRQLHRREAVVRALEAERLTAPQAVEDGQALVEQLRADARLRGLAHGAERHVVEHAQADRQHQAAARQVVERLRLPRQLPGPAAGRRDHDRADGDALVRIAMAVITTHGSQQTRPGTAIASQ